LDISIFHLNVPVLGFFFNFLTTLISSQSDTRTESYDKNTETCAEIFLET